MKRTLPLFTLLLCAGGLLAGSAATAQTKMGDNKNTLHPSAILELESTNKGFLPPRMTRAQMNAVVAPPAALIIYCLDCAPAGTRYYDGTDWVSVGFIAPSKAGFDSGSLDCNGPLGGTYTQGVGMAASNTKTVYINVADTGTYNATTDAVNCVRFVASGSLTTTGVAKPVVLTATGIPTTGGTFNYTIVIAGQRCTFPVTFAALATFGCVSATTSFTPTGTLINGTAYSGSYRIPYTAGNGQAYGATTIARNGLVLTRTAGTYAAAGDTVVYTLSGTYTGSNPTENFSLPEGCAVGVPSRYVSTFVGNGVQGTADGTGTAAQLYLPYAILAEPCGNNLYITEWGQKVRRISGAGVVTTLAGNGTTGFADGLGTDARFNYPEGLALDAFGNLFVGELFNNAIRKISPAGRVTTYTGGPSIPGSTNGPLNVARFTGVVALAIDPFGVMYVAEQFNHRIRKITPEGIVSTFAGGTAGYADGTGTAAKFYEPTGLVIDKQNNLIVADWLNNRIRKITPAGVVTTLAGSGAQGYADGVGTAATFNRPVQLALDAQGNVLVTDESGHRVRVVTPAGVVSTYAGTGVAGFAEGPAGTAQFNRPVSIAVDKAGNVFVTDANNHRIRKITP